MHKVLLLMVCILFATSCSGPAPQPPQSSASDAVAGDLPAVREQPADGRPVILAFGDSLTEGHGLPPGSGYPEQLQAALDAQGYAYRVVNAGVGGDTTSGALSRLPAMLRLEPEIVILEFGGNDGLRGLPPDQMRANLDELIAAFLDSGARVILAGMTLPRNYGADYIAAFEEVYRELAVKHSVTLIPFFLEGAAANPEYLLDDLIHPNREGYRIVTATVLQYLEPLLKRE